MYKTCGHTVIIDSNNHYDQFKQNNLGDLIQVFFNCALVSSVGRKDGTLTLTAVTLVHPKNFWEQVVTYLAHSKEHSKTSLAEYWGRGVHGRSSYLSDYQLVCLSREQRAGCRLTKGGDCMARWTAKPGLHGTWDSKSGTARYTWDSKAGTARHVGQ